MAKNKLAHFFRTAFAQCDSIAECDLVFRLLCTRTKKRYQSHHRLGVINGYYLERKRELDGTLIKPMSWLQKYMKLKSRGKD